MADKKGPPMGTHQYTRGEPGSPAKWRNTQAPKQLPSGSQLPGREHPHEARHADRIKDFEQFKLHSGYHKPGAMPGRKGRS